jgi:hypothetical protein
MCEPTTLAIAGLAGTAISAAGSYDSAQQQKKASQAIADQNWQTTQAQNKAFDTRMQAQTQRTTSDYNSYMQQIADQQASAAQMRQQQSGALSRQEQVLNAENQQAEAIRASADAQSQQMLNQTSAANLQQSQDDARTRANAAIETAVNDPNSPSPSSPTGADDQSQAAMSRRLSQAATNVRDYGQRISNVGSYSQPLQTVSEAVRGNQFGIMPAQEAGKLLQSGAGVRLLPTQLEYQGAATTGSAMDQLLSSRGEGQRGISALDASNQTAGANLQQSDTDTLAANRTAQIKADTDYNKSIGNVISSLGNLGAYGAGYYGGYNPTVKSVGDQYSWVSGMNKGFS